MADETKIIYHIDDEETPYLVKISKGPNDVTLGDFKNILNRPSYKFFFKSMDDDFGVVKEEITDDESGLPCVNGRVVAWLVTSSEGSASDVGRTFSESGSEPHDQQSVLSDPDSTGAPRTRGSGSGDSRPPSFHGRGLPAEKDTADSELESVSSRQSHRHRPRPHRSHRYKAPPVDDSCEESSVFSSDLETTSVADSEDDRRSRISNVTDGSSLYHGRHRRRRRRQRMPHVQRCTSFSTITESTLSLNIITVTLNMDKANFLGISIVGQSGSCGDGGIHVGSVMKGGAVALDGRIDPGDMLLQVNEVDFQNMSNDDAVRVLREMVHKPGPITLTVAKCWDPSPQGYFTLPQSEPVRPINTEAWVQQLAAMRVEYQAKEMVNQSLGTMTSTSSSLTSSLPESDRFNDENYCQLHVNSDMQVIVKALASSDSGLDVRDRMWLKITIPNAFIGSDLVDWLFSRVQGFTDRREARKYASGLLKAGYIRHTVNKITFSEQCYYVFGDLCGKMASISIKETDGSDQDTLAPLPRPVMTWGAAPPAYTGWRPPYPMPQQMPDNHPYNPAMFPVPSVTGSGSPRSVSSGSQKSREKEVDRESRSSGGSSASERSGSSKGDRASVKERPRPKDTVSLPPMRDYGRLETMPDNMAASRSSFQIALANPCELFVDVM